MLVAIAWRYLLRRSSEFCVKSRSQLLESVFQEEITGIPSTLGRFSLHEKVFMLLTSITVYACEEMSLGEWPNS